ncbi:UDP-3-O-acyl N-acetylglucosamine deacetylase [Rhodospirillaceae bacterium LM-1]|nr:UDP-3-O-acyl N-acetylglucosamine deacetylase [Rhodospirillaceae bacterium LM-1]
MFDAMTRRHGQNGQTAGGVKLSGHPISQRTLKNPISCTGVGLHSGVKVTMTLKPAPVDHGIVFKRTDIAGNGALIPARWDMVDDTRLCTGVSANGAVVRTIEHLMSALAGSRIDNLLIEITGPEVPVMDGSAQPFVFLIDCAGVVEQDAPRMAIRVLRSIKLQDGDRMVSLEPADSFQVDLAIDFASAVINRQEMQVEITSSAFRSEVCRARTFGLEQEVAMLRAAGLAKGGSLNNAVVIGADNKILNEDGLRYDDEFVRHKVLDAVGDLYLAGHPIQGRFQGRCSGHAMNNLLLRALLSDPTAYRLEPMCETLVVPASGAEVLPARAVAAASA